MSVNWEQARNTPIVEVVDALGLGPVGSDDKVFCFNHEERTPSLHIYSHTNRWHAYCCGRGGDVISLVVDVLGCSPVKAALWLLSTGLEPVELDSHARTEPAEVDLSDRVRAESAPIYTDEVRHAVETGAPLFRFFERNWPYIANHDALQYVTKWFGLRRSGPVALWVPHRTGPTDNVRIYGVKVRNLGADQKFSVGGSTFRHLYGSLPPSGKRERLVLCEGESDTWCMEWFMASAKDGETCHVAGLPGGAGNLHRQILDEIAAYPVVYMALDGDDAGQRATDQIVQALTPRGVEFRFLDPPGGRVAEALAAGWEVKL